MNGPHPPKAPALSKEPDSNGSCDRDKPCGREPWREIHPCSAENVIVIALGKNQMGREVGGQESQKGSCGIEKDCLLLGDGAD